jgi:hypothetical protein
MPATRPSGNLERVLPDCAGTTAYWGAVCRGPLSFQGCESRACYGPNLSGHAFVGRAGHGITNTN